MKPEISVVIPVYNVLEFLPRCLDSLLGQTFTDLELIFVDDCTPDDSMRIVQEASENDARIRMLHHKENKGLAGARNTGLDQATGKYIYFLDSDDYISINTLGDLYRAAEEHKSDMAIGKVFHWYPDEDDRLDEGYFEKCQVQDVHATNLENNPEFAVNVTAWHKLMRLDFLKEHGIRFNETIRKHEDNPFTTQVYYWADNFSYVEHAELYYLQRQSAGGLSIMSSGELSENSRWKWICLKEVMANIIRMSETSRILERRDILIQEASVTVNEILRWKLLQLTHEEAVDLAKEIRKFTRNLSDEWLRILFPDHYFLISALNSSSASQFITFLNVYYSTGKIGIERKCLRGALPTWGWIRDFWRVKKSGIFDDVFYLKNNPDARLADQSALKHFMDSGSWEGRSPAENVDLKEFIMENINTLNLSRNPVIGYLNAEQRIEHK